MNKILIFGSRGSLGSQCEQEFSSNPSFQVAAFDHSGCNIQDAQEVDRIVSEVSPDYIVNTVAYNAVDACERNDIEYNKALSLNYFAVRTMGLTALKYNAHLIHFSTNCVFAGRGAYVEHDERVPVNRYGASKILGEDSLTELSLNGLVHSVFRLPRLFGPAGMSVSSKQSFFETIRQSSMTNDELKVIDDESANFTYTKDVAQLLVEFCKDHRKGGVYHVPNEGIYSWYEAARAYSARSGLRMNIVPVSRSEFIRPAARPEYVDLVNTKLPKLRTFEEALEDYLKTGSSGD